ncbi:hypothetical protein HBI56_140590 [Parastagonospora nodorum]|nr:hypothetical protein HBH53_117500 [Parastagonospora nodorum]KAH3971582.1 hypothetical protein HBH52_156200 [Parastagonospora nodorum]KAH3996587.1 hypothetical protein HBI10_155300 [Parastagonospora nodorum]KAH4019123.1 hypothetical protein HBI13_130770 [Parastagonospora nodorum]KAH4052480.1 hypothetical protein HBH49_102140 [Parastagonospora nodorum]
MEEPQSAQYVFSNYARLSYSPHHNQRLADEERSSYTLLNTMCRDLDYACRIRQTIHGNCQGLERAWRRNSVQLISTDQRRNCASLGFLCFSCMLQYVIGELHAIQMLCTRCGVERLDVPSLR